MNPLPSPAVLIEYQNYKRVTSQCRSAIGIARRGHPHDAKFLAWLVETDRSLSTQLGKASNRIEPNLGNADINSVSALRSAAEALLLEIRDRERRAIITPPK